MLITQGNHEINKLENIEATLEKSLKGLIQKYPKCFAHVQVDDVMGATSENGEKLRDDLYVNIKGIAGQLKLKVDLLNNKKLNEIKNFDEFKREMIIIQENIINIKTSTKSELKKLNNLENYLQQELDFYYNEKVHKWNENLSVTRFEFLPPKVRTKNSGQCKEARKFQEFVHQSGGHENGWRREDHLLFLKLRKKYKKPYDLAFHLHEILPDISVENIKLHEQWYQQYLSLNEKKKMAINNWKQQKSIHVGPKTENRYLEIEPKLSRMEDSLELKQKLIKWKVEKEEKFLMEQELERQKALERIEKERTKRQKQNEIRKIVNEWRESKKLLEQCQKQQQRINEEFDKRRKAANANKLIKQFRSMDELHIFKMRQIHMKFEQDTVKRIQSSHSVARDPRRVMRPTVQWTQRVKALREPFTSPWPISAMPKLGIPEWRKSVT